MRRIRSGSGARANSGDVAGSNPGATQGTAPATLGGVSAEGVSKLVGSFNSARDRITQNAADEDAHDRAARGPRPRSAGLRKELIDHNLRQVAMTAETALPDAVPVVS